MLICCEICFVAIYAVLAQNLFCRDLRAFVWRKIYSEIVLVEKKGQISGMVRPYANSKHHKHVQKCNDITILKFLVTVTDHVIAIAKTLTLILVNVRVTNMIIFNLHNISIDEEFNFSDSQSARDRSRRLPIYNIVSYPFNI